MTELKHLFQEIAKQINKDFKDLERFYSILIENFYDTIESIRDLKAEDYEKWKFPKRITDLILTNTAQSLSNKQQEGRFQSEADQRYDISNQAVKEQPKQRIPEKMEEEIKTPQKFLAQEFEDCLLQKINEVKESISTSERQIEVLNFIKKIIVNIAENPLEQKFRRIKKQNKFFQLYFFPNRYAFEFMLFLGFSDEEEGIFMKDESVNVLLLQSAIGFIDAKVLEVTPSSFDPYKTYSSGNEVLCQGTLAQKEGFINYYDELQKLKAKRNEMMAIPLKDRKIKVYKTTSNRLNQIETQEDDVPENDSFKQFQTDLKKMIMNLENQHFASKSKMEYQKLLKEPLYSKSVIRIKFPQNIILEISFSPMETIQNVILEVQKALEAPELPFYIFNSPPRQIMDKRFYEKTLVEMGCLPGAVFYFGTDDVEYSKKSFYLKSELLSQLE